MSHFINQRIILAIFFAAALVLEGCGASTRHHRSSVVDYLYPNKYAVAEKPSVPLLELPLRVGIAFVPASGDVGTQSSAAQRGYASGTGYVRTLGPNNLFGVVDGHALIGEAERTRLMQEIGSEFKQMEFVKSIEVIPSAYLVQQGSFANLDQIATMHGIDVIALLSYDQLQHTDEGMLSMTYVTLIGAYVVEGEKNSTSTMLDAAVYDIKSRKMLFRAPGLSSVKGSATPVNIAEQLRNDSRTGYELAAKDLVANLKTQLDMFKQKVREEPKEYKIEYKPEYTGSRSGGGTGGGSVDGLLLAVVVCLGSALRWRRR